MTPAAEQVPPATLARPDADRAATFSVRRLWLSWAAVLVCLISLIAGLTAFQFLYEAGPGDVVLPAMSAVSVGVLGTVPAWWLGRRARMSCERPVLDEPEPVRLLSRAEVKTLADCWPERRWLFVIYLFVTSGWIASTVLFFMAFHGRWPLPVPALFSAIFLYTATFALSVGWLLVLLVTPPQVDCPWCGVRLNPAAVRRRNRCWHCRRPVLADPEPGGMAAGSGSG